MGGWSIDVHFGGPIPIRFLVQSGVEKLRGVNACRIGVLFGGCTFILVWRAYTKCRNIVEFDLGSVD